MLVCFVRINIFSNALLELRDFLYVMADIRTVDKERPVDVSLVLGLYAGVCQAGIGHILVAVACQLYGRAEDDRVFVQSAVCGFDVVVWKDDGRLVYDNVVRVGFRCIFRDEFLDDGSYLLGLYDRFNAASSLYIEILSG